MNNILFWCIVVLRGPALKIMSITKIHEYSGRPVMKVLCTALSMCLFYSATALSINSLVTSGSEAVQQRLENFQRLPKGHYTDSPTRVFLGQNPGRDETGRGGVWSAKLLNDLKGARQKEADESPWSEDELLLSLAPVPVKIARIAPPIGDVGGGVLPGEDDGPGGTPARSSIRILVIVM
jgi:hypothetical protein